MKNKVFISIALIFLLLSSNLISGKPREEIFFFQGEIYKDNSVDLIKFSLREGFPDNFIDPEEGLKHPDAYEFRLVTSKGGKIFSGVQMISFLIFVEPIDLNASNGSGMITPDKREIFIKMPYSSLVDFFQIFRKGKLIYSLDISKEICISDGKCLEYCQDKGDPDCLIEETTTTSTSSSTSTSTTLTTLPIPITTTTLKPKKEGYLNYLPQLILGLIILAGVIFLGYRVMKRGERTEKREKEGEIIEWLKKKLKEGEDPEVLKRGLEREGYDPRLVEKAEEKIW